MTEAPAPAANGAPRAPLLAEFPATGYDAWKALVEAELKGAPFDKKMTSMTSEGIAWRALYRADDAASVPHLGSLPGHFPFVRGATASGYLGRAWEVSQELAAPSPAEFNDAARAALSRGLTALNMVLDRATRNGADPDWATAFEVGAGGLSVATLADLERALAGVDLTRVPLFVRSGSSGMPFAALLVAVARKRTLALDLLRGCIEVDPLGVLAHEGKLAQSLQGAYREMAALTGWASRNAPKLQTICVHSRAWHEAGANAVQELGFALATAVEYLRALDARGFDTEIVAPRMRFAYSVGSQFFTEIAKLRAARMLWARLVSVLGGSATAQAASIHVRTGCFNKTVYDPYVNMLRTTVEAFAGVLGGCDSMQVGAFDEVVRPPEDFAQRVARNQQLVLREECQLTRVIDPAGGSWFVEQLTHELAQRAWGVFQEVEKRGGMAKALRSGWPQKEVARVAAERLEQVAHRRASVVGTNVYANTTEKPLTVPLTDTSIFHKRRVQRTEAARTAADDVQHQAVLDRLARIIGKEGDALFDASVDAVGAGATLGEITRAIRIQDRPDEPLTPVCQTRLASQFERLRRAMEANAATLGRRYRVFLATMGPPKQHRARADFARGFLETAGLEVIVPKGFPTTEAAAVAALDSGADAVCICSTDETYPTLVPPLAVALRAQKPSLVLLLAGYPPDQVEAHRSSGIHEFVHLRANAVEVLTRIAALLGVTP